MRAAIAVIFFSVLLMSITPAARAHDSYAYYPSAGSSLAAGPADVLNRPANVQGLTGLIITSSAFTQPKGRIVLGLASIAMNSQDPNFSIAQGIVTVTAGVADNLELGLRGQVIATNLGSSANREVGSGDTDLLVKWNCLDENEFLPAIAIGLEYTFPTGDKDKGLRGIEDQSVRLILLGSSEQETSTGSFIGMYVEGQIVQTDRLPGGDRKATSEKYGVMNAGILFPITDDRQLQALVEYNAVVKKDIPSLYEVNHKSFMPGLRFVTEKWNMSLGIQFFHPSDQPLTNNLRYLGTLSYAF